MSAGGVDLRPLWQQLIGKLIEGTIKAGEGLDLSLIAQLLGDKHAGIAIQREILLSQRSFRSSCVNGNPSLRVLALAAATDIGSNTPIEFLLQNSDIELTTLYIVPEFELPERLPDHARWATVKYVVHHIDSWMKTRLALAPANRSFPVLFRYG